MSFSSEPTIITPCMWFKTSANAAASFYVSLFPNSRIISASPMAVSFELDGRKFMALNGLPYREMKFNERLSFQVACKDQEDVDRFWEALLAGPATAEDEKRNEEEEGDKGVEQRFGWLKDRFGISWQVVPECLPKFMGHQDKVKREKAMKALMNMKKIVIKEVEEAMEG